MDFDFDSSYIIYGFGALLGIISIVYFGSEVILGLSPTVKSILLIFAFVLFFISGNRTSRFLSIGFYMLSAASYVVFLFYMPSKFDFTTDQTFVLLALSSILFMALGYSMKQGKISIGSNWFWTAAAIIIGLALALVVFDTLSAQPGYSLDLKESVSFGESRETEIGHLEIRNDFVFSRDVDMPNYRGCLYLSKRFDVSVSPREHLDMIDGGETLRADLKSNAGRALAELNQTSINNIEVKEMESCPEDLTGPLLVVVRNKGDKPYISPAPVQ